ncbi:MAG: DUF2341 domain-containing protein [Anaerolineae bacterium]
MREYLIRFFNARDERDIVLALGVLLVLLVSTPVVLAQSAGDEYFVAPGGDDANPGTIDAPFRTVQRCADVARPGDTCTLRTGTYREVVRPPISGTVDAPITFRAYPGEVATLSGAEVLFDDVYTSGVTLTLPMSWTFDVRESGDPHQVSNDQIFVNGQMMPEARWPNIPYAQVTRTTTDDFAQADEATVTDSYHATYVDADLSSLPPGAFDGAKITFAPGYGIVHITCDVTRQTTDKVSFACNEDPGAWGARSELDQPGTMRGPSPGNYYYLWGTPGALDAPGEWFRTGPADDGQLLLNLPERTGETAHYTVEARRRPWVFDLRDRSHIVIDGLQFFAGTILYDDNTHHTTVQNIVLRYPWHVQELPPFSWTDGTRALDVRGTNNVIRDSLLAHAPSLMILLGGARNRAENNVIYEAGYMGIGAAIAGERWPTPNPGGAERNVATQNTIFDVGRLGVGADPGLDITYNDLYRSHLLISDLGTIYGWGDDGNDAHIAYNLVHDNQAELNLDLNYFGGHGIYLDDDTYNYWVYRNITWDTTSPGIFTMGTNGTVVDKPADTPSNRYILHNTVIGAIGTHAKDDYQGRPQTLTGTVFINNRATTLDLDDATLTTSHNQDGEGLYVDPATHDYRLRPYAPAVDAGMELGSPSQDPPMAPLDAAPDVGALERGRVPFVAGAVLRAGDVDALDVRCEQTAAGDVDCRITGLPLGRKLPADLALRVGESGTPSDADDCRTVMDYAVNQGVGVCTGLPVEGLSGTQPIYFTLGDGWQATGATVTLGELTLSAVTPPQGPPSGGTRLTLTGRRFATGPAGYAVPITLTNAATTARYAYPVPITLDTASPIAAGRLRPDCGDLRFRTADQTLPHWLEDGCGTAQTRVWVKAPYIPPGQSTITATYGNLTLTSTGDGEAVFPTFFDDFADGVWDETYWVRNTGAWYTVEETEGNLRVAGETDTSTRYKPVGPTLRTWKLDLPATYAVDAELTVVEAPYRFKAQVGSWDLSLYGAEIPKRIGYYDGGWQQAGTSTITTTALTRRRFSIGYTGAGDTWTVRWLENGDLDDVRASRTVAEPDVGGFTFSPDSVVAFDARFDNVRLRPYAYPEPTAAAGGETAVGVTVLLGDDGVRCRNVVVHGPTTATCTAPPLPVGRYDVTIVNPDGSRDVLPQGYEVVEAKKVYLPLILRVASAAPD